MIPDGILRNRNPRERDVFSSWMKRMLNGETVVEDNVPVYYPSLKLQAARIVVIFLFIILIALVPQPKWVQATQFLLFVVQVFAILHIIIFYPRNKEDITRHYQRVVAQLIVRVGIACQLETYIEYYYAIVTVSLIFASLDFYILTLMCRYYIDKLTETTPIVVTQAAEGEPYETELNKTKEFEDSAKELHTVRIFKCGTTTRKLKLEVATPEELAKVFNLKLSPIQLRDDSGQVYKVIDGSFDPPLSVTGEFVVYGLNEEGEAEPTLLNPDASSGGSEPLITSPAWYIGGMFDFIDATKVDLISASNLAGLVSAVEASVMVEKLDLISAFTSDPSLTSATMPSSDSFKRLWFPHSFRDSLSQIRDTICYSLRVAEHSFEAIRVILEGIPGNFEDILEAVSKDEDGAAEYVREFCHKIPHCLANCKYKASQPTEAFDNTILDIYELVQATVSKMCRSEIEEKIIVQLKAEYKAEKALREHEAEIVRRRSFTESMDILTGSEDSVLSEKVDLELILSSASNFDLKSDHGKIIKEEVKRVLVALRKLTSVSKKSYGFVVAADKYSNATKEYDQACLHLQAALRDAEVANEKHEEEHQKNVDVPTEDTSRMVTTINKSTRESGQLNEFESEKYDHAKQKLLEVKRKMSELLVNIAEAKTNDADWMSVVQYLLRGCAFLVEVKKSWMKMEKILTNIKDTVDNFVKPSILVYIETENKNSFTGKLTQRLMIKSALSVCGMALQAGNYADLYEQLSKKYIIPAINRDAKEFISDKYDKMVLMNLESEAASSWSNIEKLMESTMERTIIQSGRLNKQYSEKLQKSFEL